MITENLIDFCISMLRGLFASFEFINLPQDLISALSSIVVYGNWVVGSDIMILFVASVTLWWSVHLSVGIAYVNGS